MKLFDWLGARLFGDRTDAHERHVSLQLDQLSAFLPWRVYDPASRLYLNRQSRGFVIEIAPLVGANDQVAESLAQFFSESLPAGSRVQVLHWMSPRVGRVIDAWFAKRYAVGGVYEHMARHRADYLKQGVWDSLSGDAPFHLRRHRVFISVGVAATAKAGAEALVSTRESLQSALRSLEVDSRTVEPEGLIELVDELTSPTTISAAERCAYSALDPIADQAVRRDIELRIEPERMVLRTERFRMVGRRADGTPSMGEVLPDRFDLRHFGVRAFPQRWAPWDMARLIGDLFSSKLRMPCPVATICCFAVPEETAAKSRASYKFMRTTSLVEGRSARFIPSLRDQQAEWQYVHEQLGNGRKLVQLYYGLLVYAPEGRGDRYEEIVRSVYAAAGWELIDERFLQVQGLLAALPLTFADGLCEDMLRLKRLRSQLTTAAASLVPVQGEYLGGAVPHLLLVGRRGQPFFWSPFENSAGNHNTVVIGKSGSGKSVLLQELVAALRGAGARVLVLDDGRSFEHSAKLQGGQFIEFTLSSGIGLNPFSMVDPARARDDEDYRLESLTFIRTILGQMARFTGQLTDAERGLMDEAVNRVWADKGQAGSIDDVAEHLAGSGEMGDNLAASLKPYRSSGTYGSFFAGPASLRLEDPFTVFEMAELRGKVELRAVVLAAILFSIMQMMMSRPRQELKAVLLDEAHQHLQGGSIAEAVALLARTIRKYRGSLITATQSLNDYYLAEGSKAALENSDWMLLLQQTAESILDFRKNARFQMDDATETLLRSVRRQGEDYSEVYIRGPDMTAIGRLVLDRYSGTVYSSSPTVFAAIEAEVAQGRTMAEAIETVAFGAQQKPQAKELDDERLAAE